MATSPTAGGLSNVPPREIAMTDLLAHQHHADDHRAHELYHYFQPDNPALLTQPSYGSHCSPVVQTIQGDAQKCSPNIVLTAIAQLAAMKLGCQRAIIRYVQP